MNRFVVYRRADGFLIVDTQTGRYGIGDPTDPDLQTLEAFLTYLNSMETEDVLDDYELV